MAKISVDNVNEEVWVMFKTHVMQKRKKIKGVIGLELTDALRLYLEKEGFKKERGKIP